MTDRFQGERLYLQSRDSVLKLFPHKSGNGSQFSVDVVTQCAGLPALEKALYDVLCEARVIATWASPEGVSAIDQAYIQIVEQNEIKDGFDAALATDYARGIVEFIANVFHNLLDPDGLGLDPEIATETRLKEFHEATTREDDPSA